MMLFRNNTAWDPFKEWDRFFTDYASANRAPQAAHHSPRYEVQEKEDGFLLSLDIPGVKKDDIKIETKGRTLTVTAKRHSTKSAGEGREESSFSYAASFELPEVVKLDATEASYQDGVLTLGLPKVKEASARTIKVTDGRSDFLGKLVQGFKKEDANKEVTA